MRTKTPISYYGGKQTMLKHILPLIPEHEVYTEAFCGGAAIFFAKTPVKVEVLNDLNGELMNFYQVFKRNGIALQKEIDETIHSRNLHTYAQFIYQYPEFFTKVKRAWALWYLSKTGFASRLDGSYGYDKSRNESVKRLGNAKEYLMSDTIAKRLENVQLECNDALKIIKSRDKATTFHFIDPPYVNTDLGHYAGYNESHFEDLLKLCQALQGKFMLTMFPNDMLKHYLNKNEWRLKEVERNISASKTNRRKQVEWIVMNY